VKANTLTYQSGKFAGNEHGREEIGFVPWQFNLPDAGYEAAWKFLMDPQYFFADYGPSTVERNDPQFYLSKSCCWWSGQSWPYATTQTLKALANLLHDYKQGIVTRADYMKLLQVYTQTQRKAGRPYIAEAAHPDTGSWEGHDSYNHSEHYFHSGYNDLIITGLIGLKPRADDILEIDPLAPPDWPYFALDDLRYRGHQLTIVWDKDGSRYHRGAGLRVMADGKELASLNRMGKISAALPTSSERPISKVRRVNYAVNNDGLYFPRVSASFADAKTPLSRVNDGNYWYHIHPPNRWTCADSTNEFDWLAIDFGAMRKVDTVKLYFLDDGTNVVAPARYSVEAWDGIGWKPLPAQRRIPEQPTGHRANRVQFAAVEVQKLRAVFTHASEAKTGLTEIEAWGDAADRYVPAPPPRGNVALNSTGSDFPKATASFSDRFGGAPQLAIDGKVVFRPTPLNRWTSYGSTNSTDWLEIDFGAAKRVSRAELYIYDDRGGVQAPAGYELQYWLGDEWRDVMHPMKAPGNPTGNMANSVVFDQVTTTKMRVLFRHKGKARSGVTEVELWEK